MENKEVIILLAGIIIGILLGMVFDKPICAFNKKEKSHEVEIKRLRIVESKWEESDNEFLFISYYPPISEDQKPQWLKDLDRAVEEINRNRKKAIK